MLSVFVQVARLPTNAVRVAVDKVFVGVHEPRESRPESRCTKIDQAKSRFFGAFLCG